MASRLGWSARCAIDDYEFIDDFFMHEIPFMVVKRDCFMFSDCEPESNLNGSAVIACAFRPQIIFAAKQGG